MFKILNDKKKFCSIFNILFLSACRLQCLTTEKINVFFYSPCNVGLRSERVINFKKLLQNIISGY
jgi:hypothetical protein